MDKSSLIAIASTGALVPYLRGIRDGVQFDDWVMNGLYDRGLIDGDDKLTPKAEAILDRD